MAGRRMLAGTVAVVLLATACGGGESDAPGAANGEEASGDGSEENSTADSTADSNDSADTAGGAESGTAAFGSSDIGDENWDAARALADAHGADGGFAALMYALERGYDGAQIVAAAMAGQIDDEGNIVVDGSPLAPSGSRGGVFPLPGEEEGEGEGAAAFSVTLSILIGPIRRGSQLDRADLFAELVFGAEALAPVTFREADQFDITTADPTVASALVLALAASGYNAEQITDALTQGSILGLDTVRDVNVFGGTCPALYDDATGAVLPPLVPVDSLCRKVVDVLVLMDEDEDEPVAESSLPADAPTEELEFATYSGSATSEALGAAELRSGGYGSLTFEASVENSDADLEIKFTYFAWVRGGQDGGPSGDQNCGGLFDVWVVGEGPTGSPTSISMEVVSMRQIDTVGALCQDGDFDFVMSAPGDRLGRFDGQLNGLGLSGEYSGGAWFAPIQLEAG